MTKQRRPGTIEAALWRAKEILGIEVLADICGKTENMVSKWLDIDDDRRNFPAKYIYAVDAACKAETGETPLTSHLNRRMGATESARGCPKNAALGIATEAGRVAHLIDVATSPSSPGGTGLEHCEAVEILPALDQVDRATERARARVKRYLGTSLKEVS